VALLCACSPASGQDGPQHIDPKGCAPSERLQTVEPKPGASGPSTPQTTTGENLSDKLARTDGVLCPPNVDPDIRQPAPGGGKTPVIPPPGSPDGDQSIQPK
jgi:hypothetical protein